MPHDRDGHELKVGDTVLVPCKVKAIHLTEDYCNVDLETARMWPSDQPSSLTLNSRRDPLSELPHPDRDHGTGDRAEGDAMTRASRLWRAVRAAEDRYTLLYEQENAITLKRQTAYLAMRAAQEAYMKPTARTAARRRG
jgi:hypothetical protein